MKRACLSNGEGLQRAATRRRKRKQRHVKQPAPPLFSLRVPELREEEGGVGRKGGEGCRKKAVKRAGSTKRVNVD